MRPSLNVVPKQTFTSLPPEVVQLVFEFVLPLPYPWGGRSQTRILAALVPMHSTLQAAITPLLYRDVAVRPQDVQGYVAAMSSMRYRFPTQLYLQHMRWNPGGNGRLKGKDFEEWHNSLLPYLARRIKPALLSIDNLEEVSLLDLETFTSSA